MFVITVKFVIYEKDIDKFIQVNKNNFDPGNLTLINKLKK